MIKKFSEHINEDYFSKLASRKDNGNVRKENELTEHDVMEYFDKNNTRPISITIRKENDNSVVDIDGWFILKKDTEEIPFQFGKVTGSFRCNDCKKLTSLKGCPKEVGGIFTCSYCDNLTSLEYVPEKVGGNFLCENCGRKFTKNEVQSRCKVKGEIFV